MRRRQWHAAIVAGSLMADVAGAAAPTFGNGPDGASWADTPRGRFECRCDKATRNLQVLRLAGEVIFAEKPTPEGIVSDGSLSSGIAQQNVGCPAVIASRDGHVVLVRDTQPPRYGVQGYVIVDFNAKGDPPVTELGEGVRPRDDKIADTGRLAWTSKGVTLRYFGYRLDEDSGETTKLTPQQREVFYDFAQRKAVQVR